MNKNMKSIISFFKFTPTEAAAESYLKVLAEANENPADMHSRPLTTYVRRLDEVTAARSPIVKYEAPTA